MQIAKQINFAYGKDRHVPAGKPGCKWAPLVSAKLGAPEVESPGRRVRRTNLSHRETDNEAQQPHGRETVYHRERAAVLQAVPVHRGQTREYGHDGEGHREVGYCPAQRN